MMNYRDIISRTFADLGESVRFIDDPNVEIDPILSNEQINWYPYYLIICKDQFFMFLPFSYENFIDDSEIKEECRNAQHLVNCLKKQGISSKVFFITNVNKDVETLEEQNLSDDFGILHNELEKPLLDFSITNIFKVTCRLSPNILEYLSDCRNLKGKIGNLVREFSRRYLDEQPEGDTENEMIKEFMGKILTCDERFKLDVEPIDFMAEMEKIVSVPEGRIRDHYFHAFNTMMLGFMIIDKFHNRFDALAKKRADDIVLEFIWVLTSLYHDIGYPIPLQRSLICQTYGLERENNLPLIDDYVKQLREEFWNSPDYCLIVEMLNNLFGHITRSQAGKWVFNGFPRLTKSTKFKNSMKVSFVQEGSHGAAGTLRLGLLTNKQIKDVEKNKDREFLYRHTMLASMSILFHDSKVRDCFRRNSIKQIEAEDFPFSALLTYVDILQDDRRDPTGSSSRPDILKDISVVDGKIIVAKLDERVLTRGIRKKLFEELEEALSFFIMNGLRFAIPQEVPTGKAKKYER